MSIERVRPSNPSVVHSPNKPTSHPSIIVSFRIHTSSAVVAVTGSQFKSMFRQLVNITLISQVDDLSRDELIRLAVIVVVYFLFFLFSCQF